MNRVLGIGETVFDIVFKDNRPVAGVPGGSVFNGLITLGRLGIPGLIISEAGSDRIGDIITDFLKDNGICADYVSRYPGKKSCISLAFLDEKNDAHYTFYKDYPACRLEFELPPVEPGDVVLFGSYYPLNPALRPQVLRFLRYAKEHGAILYYDINFRENHKPEVAQLTPDIEENMRLADIVRGSTEDFKVLYECTDPATIYETHVKNFCKNFILTCGSEGVYLKTDANTAYYPSKKVDTVSTIGAGDNFNAGIAYGILKSGVKKADALTAADWDLMIGCGIDFGTEACCTTDNYVSREFAKAYAAGQNNPASDRQTSADIGQHQLHQPTSAGINHIS